MDFRLQRFIEEWKKTKGLSGDVDVISIAGSCKDLSNYSVGTCEANYVMAMITLAVEKHGVENVILTQHEDCGAYGGKTAFANDEAELAKTIGDMKKAKKALLERFPNLKVEMFRIKQKGEDWEFEAIND
jgi:carbonic anhydrase